MAAEAQQVVDRSPPVDRVTPDMLNPNRRLTIDQEVFDWVAQQQTKDKIVTPNSIRQRAFEIGQRYDPNFKASLNWYNNWKKRYEYQESPEAEALKRRKKSYTAAFKLFAVHRAMELNSISHASLELNVSRRCLQRWKDEIDLITTVAEQASNAVYRRPGQGRKVSDTGLDTQLLEWVKEKWKEGTTVNTVMVRQKAREISENPDFKASLGWFVKWQKRHNVDLKERTIDSNTNRDSQDSPLKLRLLPEGQASMYSEHSSKTARKRKRDYDEDIAAHENDEEFDRALLTWLVEKWEMGRTVSDKLLREKAAEIAPSSDFLASKAWVILWKQKYNVSLENQTYGNAGEAEGEIVEETPVYDEVTIQEENPLTPTKEEAATALASLAADEHGSHTAAHTANVSGGERAVDIASGLEIAEALQKLASAFGLTQTTAKEAIAHFTAAPQGAVTDAGAHFLLEGGNVEEMVPEEVVAEEVVTDEPVVVIDNAASSTNTTLAQTATSSSITSSSVDDSFTPTTVSQLLAQSLATVNQTTPTISTTGVDNIAASSVIEGALPMAGVVTEEVVISEPMIETFVPQDTGPTITLDESQVMMLMENGTIVSSSSVVVSQPDSVVTVSSLTPSASNDPPAP